MVEATKKIMAKIEIWACPAGGRTGVGTPPKKLHKQNSLFLLIQQIVINANNAVLKPDTYGISNNILKNFETLQRHFYFSKLTQSKLKRFTK